MVQKQHFDRRLHLGESHCVSNLIQFNNAVMNLMERKMVMLLEINHHVYVVIIQRLRHLFISERLFIIFH